MPFVSRDIDVHTTGSDYEVVTTITPLVYHDRFLTETTFIPSGFRSDYGSIPRLLMPLFPRTEFRPEYILHDYQWTMHPDEKYKYNFQLMRALYEINVPIWKMVSIYLGVTIGAMLRG